MTPDFRNVVDIWTLLPPNEVHSCVYIAELVPGWNTTNYFTRPNFVRSKFLYNMDLPH